jgi:hypothetical protein
MNPPFLVYFCTYLGLLLSSYRYLTLASSLLALELLVAGLDFGLMNSNRNELLFGFSLDSSLSFCIQRYQKELIFSQSLLLERVLILKWTILTRLKISRFNVTFRCQKFKINKIVCVRMYTNLILGRFS